MGPLAGALESLDVVIVRAGAGMLWDGAPCGPYTGRFFGKNASQTAWEADGKDVSGDVSPSASQADPSKKPTRVSPCGRPGVSRRCHCKGGGGREERWPLGGALVPHLCKNLTLTLVHLEHLFSLIQCGMLEE